MPKTASGPDFLGIGAQKAGTTWLWTHLMKHPSVWMPPRKEVHYFDRYYPAPNYLSEAKLWKRLFVHGEPRQTWREMMKADFRGGFRQRDWKMLRWYSRFYFGAGDDAWYCSLFRPGQHRKCGEITPAYSILPEVDVARIARLLPSLKVILLLRNPIDRAWSQLRFDWTRGARTGVANLEETKAFIDSPKQELRGSYLRMLDLWGRHFPPGRLFVGFYDEIATHPGDLLERVHRFLDIEPQPLPMKELNCKVHVSREAAMPPEIRRYLAMKYLPELIALEQRFGNPVTAWLAAARAEAEMASWTMAA
jgi:Sulfotransferase family